MKQFQQACVGGFIQNSKGEILLVKRSEQDDFLPGKWELPGGAVDFGESPQEAAKREVKEEIGLDVEVSKPLSVNWYFMETPDDKIQRIGITFLCTVIGKDMRVQLSNEHVEYRWCKKSQIHMIELTSYMTEIIRNCFINRGN